MPSDNEHPDDPGLAAAEADAQRRIDAIVLSDPRVVALVEAVFSAQNNARSGYDMLASVVEVVEDDWDKVLDSAKKLKPRSACVGVDAVRMDAKLLTLQRLAHRTGLPAAWLKREADAGRLPCIHAGRFRMFDLSSVLRALADRKEIGAARGK